MQGDDGVYFWVGGEFQDKTQEHTKGSDEVKVYLLKQLLNTNGLFEAEQGKNFVTFPQISLSASANLQLNEDGHIKPSGCQSRTTQLNL